jgi:hypothetical protein
MILSLVRKRRRSVLSKIGGRVLPGSRAGATRVKAQRVGIGEVDYRFILGPRVEVLSHRHRLARVRRLLDFLFLGEMSVERVDLAANTRTLEGRQALKRRGGSDCVNSRMLIWRPYRWGELYLSFAICVFLGEFRVLHSL